jgi:hypothetical protein
MLDPQRFILGEQIKDPRLLDQVMVRRLKDELRDAVPGLKLPKREVVQHDISGLPDDAPDLARMRLLTQYRALREKRLEGSRRSQQTAANLVITTLQKRLFSSIEAFNSTLRVHRKSMEKLAAATEVEPEVSADLLTELNAPDADDDRADRPEEEVTEGIEQAVASATERSKGSQQISQDNHHTRHHSARRSSTGSYPPLKATILTNTARYAETVAAPLRHEAAGGSKPGARRCNWGHQGANGS